MFLTQLAAATEGYNLSTAGLTSKSGGASVYKASASRCQTLQMLGAFVAATATAVFFLY